MFKETRWAKEIIALQQKDGRWGYFHTLSEPDKNPITTEQALRRLEILGYTLEDECIEKTVRYMHECLTGKKDIPDRVEKVHDWSIFTKLMLSTWIRRFTKYDDEANKISNAWSSIISAAFKSGAYSQNDFLTEYKNVFSKEAKGGRLIDFISFYPISLIADVLETKVENLVFDYVMEYPNGIYYLGYNRAACSLPDKFSSKEASRYLGTIELLSRFKNNRHKLKFVTDWLNQNKNSDGMWDMTSSVKDHVYFPLSDSWRDKNTRISDCTYRIKKLIETLNIAL
ncbi:MAG: hypothetical protein K0R54_5932 [Clostridiaceae bacterium]|jgi:hypothetical protein|nr:hypothetical protein [Clostridiaceae bacterium]